MKITLLAVLSLFITPASLASGPIAPTGWSGSFEPMLPNGEACCLPADLNGAKMVGGAFVLISTNGKEVGLFALTYSGEDPEPKENWQLLEHHPISVLAKYRVSLEPAGRYPFGAIIACTELSQCAWYAAVSSSAKLSRVKQSGR